MCNFFKSQSIEKLLAIVYETFRIIDSSKKKKIKIKKDGSIVTQADIEVENHICNKLGAIDKSITIISEEKDFKKSYFLKKKYWLIDPIDGTSNYESGGSEFTVNIALIVGGMPVLGLIGHPPSKKIWYSIEKNAFLVNNNKTKKLLFSDNVSKNPSIICSKNLDYKTRSFIKKYKFNKIQKLSSSLKFCRIAEGKADIYPRFFPISKWDIAAGDAIVRGMGGITIDEKGKPFNYLTESSSTGKFYVASNNFYKKFLIQNAIFY